MRGSDWKHISIVSEPNKSAEIWKIGEKVRKRSSVTCKMIRTRGTLTPNCRYLYIERLMLCAGSHMVVHTHARTHTHAHTHTHTHHLLALCLCPCLQQYLFHQLSFRGTTVLQKCAFVCVCVCVFLLYLLVYREKEKQINSQVNKDLFSRLSNPLWEVWPLTIRWLCQSLTTLLDEDWPSGSVATAQK